MAQTGVALFVADINLADVLGQNVGLLVFRCRTQFLVFKQLVISQHSGQLVFDGGVGRGEGEQTRLIHQAAVVVLAWLPYTDTSFLFVISQEALVEDINSTVRIGCLFLAVVLVKSEK